LDGIAEYERALQLDPLSAVITTELGWVYGYMEDFERALKQYDLALEMDPDLAIAHFNRGDALQKMGRLEESIGAYDRSLELSPGTPFARAFRGSALAAAGKSELALEVLAELEEEETAGRPISTFIAVLLESLGKKEAAMASLRRAIARREPIAHGLSSAIGFLSFPSLRGTPEFQDLLDEIEIVLAGESG
jgi:tetratricopeptide (TPR) repeat protein